MPLIDTWTSLGRFMNTLGCFVNIVCEATPLRSPWRLKIDEEVFLKDLWRPNGIILSFSPLLDGAPSFWVLMYLMYCTYGFDHFQFYCFVRILLEVCLLYYFTPPYARYKKIMIFYCEGSFISSYIKRASSLFELMVGYWKLSLFWSLIGKYFFRENFV